MRFDLLPLENALGVLLAHSIATPGGTIKKGRPLSAADVTKLLAAGLHEVFAGRLEDGDVGEDAAAQSVAAQIAGRHATVAKPFTGRANIYAAAAGLAHIDAAAVHALNAIDESVTVATVMPFERVVAGQMLATVKIIPFAVSASTMAAVRAVDAAAGSVGLAPFAPVAASLILTRLPGTKPTVLDKRRDVIAERLRVLGAALAETVTIDHSVDAVARAIARSAEAGHDPILVFAASAIVDRGDVVPKALEAAGGRVIRLGMPVDPGNLMLYGELGSQPVIGIPSCAGSPKLNGFDWVLARVIARLPVTSADIAAMGVGGLLKEISTRPQPRDGADGMTESDVRSAPRIASIVLAGGRSSRMGSVNKLLQVVGGKPVVRHTVDASLASGARPVIVVLGHNGADVRQALAGLDVTFVDNPRYAEGISTSVKAGLAALPPSIDGALVALGDMPEVPPTLLDRMISAFAPKEGRGIVMPTFNSKRGNPVLWSAQYFSEMQELAGDTGAKHLLGLYAEDVAEIDAGDVHVLTDVDTPQALAALKARLETDR